MYERTPAFQPGVHTDIDHLLYSLVYMIIDRERQRMGWLNPYARPFIPEKNQKNQDPVTNTKITNEGTHRRTASEPKNPTINQKKYPRIQKILSTSPTISKQAQGEFSTKWIKEGKVFRKQNNTTSKRIRITNKHNNRYQVLDENNEVENNNVVVPHIITDIKLEETVKDRNRLQKTIKNAKELEEKYDIECMTVATMEAHLSSFATKMLLDRGSHFKSVEEKSRENKECMEQFIKNGEYSQAEQDEAEINKGNNILELMEYLWVSELKAQQDEYSRFRDEAWENGQGIIKAYEEAVEKNNKAVQMYDEIVDDYNDLVERYQNERKKKECMECRRNKTRYKSCSDGYDRY